MQHSIGCMRLGWISVVVLSACGGGAGSKTPTPATPATPATPTEEAPPKAGAAAATWPAPPDGFATADLIGIRGGELFAYAIADGKVVETGKTKLAEVDPEDYTAQPVGQWADRDHFFVHIPPRTVVVVTAGAIASIAVPEAAKFKTPRPETEDDEGLEEGGVMEGVNSGLVVTDGAAWWSECPWGYPYDGWQCEVYVNAELWPAQELVPGGGPLSPREWSWVEVKPAGFAVAVAEDSSTATCTPPKGAGKKVVLVGDADNGEKVVSAHWVSASPPRLLVVYGQEGMDDLVPSSWAFHDGCKATPLVQGTEVEPGPSDLWIAWESDDPRAEEVVTRPVLRRGATVIGELPQDVRLFFRPAAK